MFALAKAECPVPVLSLDGEIFHVAYGLSRLIEELKARQRNSGELTEDVKLLASIETKDQFKSTMIKLFSFRGKDLDYCSRKHEEQVQQQAQE